VTVMSVYELGGNFNVGGVRRREADADPSTHHPQAEERLGPLSLRMTTSFLVRAQPKCITEGGG